MTKLISDTENLLDRIYDAAFSDTFFDTILDALRQFLPGTAILLIGQDARQPSGNFLLHRGLGADASLANMACLAIDNPCLQKLWQEQEGVVYQGGEQIPDPSVQTSKKAKHWLALMGQMVCATGLVLNRRLTRQLVLEVRYPAADRSKLSRDVTALLSELGPHLVRAVKIMHLNFNYPNRAKLANDILEVFPFPMLVIDTDCHVRCINGPAETLADTMETFFISAEGGFHAADLDAELELRKVVQQLSNGHPYTEQLIALPSADRSRRAFVSLAKLGKSVQRQLGPCSVYERQSARLALIIQDTNQPLKISHHALWSAFQLTNAEAELASLLLEGNSVGECAHRQSLAKQTLRNHLGAIMKKTRTNRQPQLVGLLTRLALSTMH